MKLVIARSALNDLLDIKAYYTEQGVPEDGQRFVNTILEKAQKLTDQPDSGRKVPEFYQQQIRELIYPPFRIIYLRHASVVSLVRVWRSERLLLLPEDET
ncbi:Plasmid stabilization system protein ParE [Arsukibacterium tuosuense]|uniref:Plasmid stabilization system protein ParE n=1 Tax=Arsukibacterium tuosuense TaxID=1323745 RepID=A0A285INL1_9GAMM|nr:type II toxin-antitoxin system RelE/ParE family toxin [Arsukibacterium tuosuense]SNY49534.1 Plasmid stabilization system protein ParE [Arsukibacterium tuosuense]